MTAAANHERMTPLDPRVKLFVLFLFFSNRQSEFQLILTKLCSIYLWYKFFFFQFSIIFPYFFKAERRWGWPIGSSRF